MINKFDNIYITPVNYCDYRYSLMYFLKHTVQSSDMQIFKFVTFCFCEAT
jgi:hypothetical protein